MRLQSEAQGVATRAKHVIKSRERIKLRRQRPLSISRRTSKVQGASVAVQVIVAQGTVMAMKHMAEQVSKIEKI